MDRKRAAEQQSIKDRKRVANDGLRRSMEASTGCRIIVDKCRRKSGQEAYKCKHEGCSFFMKVKDGAVAESSVIVEKCGGVLKDNKLINEFRSRFDAVAREHGDNPEVESIKKSFEAALKHVVCKHLQMLDNVLTGYESQETMYPDSDS